MPKNPKPSPVPSEPGYLQRLVRRWFGSSAKRFAVIKRRFWTMLILKTQKPEYYSICQRKIYELERENRDLRARLETQGLNLTLYYNRLEKVLKHLGQIKELKRVRGLPSPNLPREPRGSTTSTPSSND